jgi:SAM-dependent methyltransferase
MNSYRRAILRLISEIADGLPVFDRALDFGCGDGWFSSQFLASGQAKGVVSVDVARRKHCYVEPIIYNGAKLPFRDKEFDFVYAIDVLHHCADPLDSLADLMRCTCRYLLLKDHTYKSWLGWAALCVLDELGNRRFGIPSLYRYQRNWQWFSAIEESGFRLLTLIHPAPCHTGVLGTITNNLQFVGLWERVT